MMTVTKRLRSWGQTAFHRLPVEPVTLGAVCLVASLLWIFVALAEDVVERERDAFDTSILEALRVPGNLGQPIGPGWLLDAFREITALGSPTLITLVTAAATAYLLVARRARLALLVLMSIGSGAVVENLLKTLFHRARPEVVPHLVEVTSLSFPSGHAMLSAMTYLTIGALVAQAQATVSLRAFVMILSLVATALIGCSRVYLGVHWPSDVLAGWAGGAAWALLFWLLARWLSRRR